jgi:putative toxin-antitoxin system antitoxin component (TIGR02293 family)
MKSKKTNKKLLAAHEVNIVNEPGVAYLHPVDSIDMRMVRLLDGKKSTIPFHNETDVIDWIRGGISKKSLDHLITQIGYSIADIASVLHVSDRNLRRYMPSEKLNTEQSERLVEIARLYAKGEDVFGSIAAFNQWMNAQILSLGHQMPKSFLDTSLGVQLLMKELSRIEQGVYA